MISFVSVPINGGRLCKLLPPRKKKRAVAKKLWKTSKTSYTKTKPVAEPLGQDNPAHWRSCSKKSVAPMPPAGSGGIEPSPDTEEAGLGWDKEVHASEHQRASIAYRCGAGRGAGFVLGVLCEHDHRGRQDRG